MHAPVATKNPLGRILPADTVRPMAWPVTSLDDIQPIHLRLEKYHALGNDFLISVMSDEKQKELNARSIDWADLAQAACDRKSGIGADGLILAIGPTTDDYEWSSTSEDGSLEPHASLSGKATVRMILHNSDGSKANVSGNGMGCLAHAVARSQEPWKSSRLHAEALLQVPFCALPSGTDRGTLTRRLRASRLNVTIKTAAGNRRVTWNNNIQERIHGPQWMVESAEHSLLDRPGRLADFFQHADTEQLAGDLDPKSWNALVEMPAVMPGPDVPADLEEKIRRDFGDTNFDTGDVGNPHLVVNAGRELDLSEVARYGNEYASHFADGINVEFIHVPQQGVPELYMQVWERGAGITDACGTGAVVATHLAMRWELLTDAGWEQLQQEWRAKWSDESGRDAVESRFPSGAPYALIRMPGGTARVFFGDASGLEGEVPDRLLFEPLLCLMANYVGGVDYPILRHLQA